MSDIDAATPAPGPGAAEEGGKVMDSSSQPVSGESGSGGEETLPVKEEQPTGEVAAGAEPGGGEETADNGQDAAGPGDGGDDAGTDSEAAGERGSRREVRSRSGTESLQRLEEEGEVAADYLEELLDIADLDGDIDIDVENGRASVAIVAEGSAEGDLRRLVGSKGEVLEALQELARLAVQARTGDRSRLMLDVAGFRAARRRALEDVAARACREVQRNGASMRLDPMTAFERKVIHDVVAEAGLVSESEGEEPQRRVVVRPAT